MANAILSNRLAEKVLAMGTPNKNHEKKAWIRYSRDYSGLLDDVPPKKETAVSCTKNESSISGQKRKSEDDLTAQKKPAKVALKEIEKELGVKLDAEEKTPEVVIERLTQNQLQQRMANLPPDEVMKLAKYIRHEVNIRTARMLKSGPVFSTRDAKGEHAVHPWEEYHLTKDDYEKDMEWLKLIYKEDQPEEILMQRWKWGREHWTQKASMGGNSRGSSLRIGRIYEMQAREAIVKFDLLQKK